MTKLNCRAGDLAVVVNDRELLELAAKAVGGWLYDGLDGLCICTRTSGAKLWNPLRDDGDALRLAVKLRLSIVYQDEFVLGECVQTVEVMSEERENGSRVCMMQSLDADACAATRRAIVRAAAEIGRNL